LSCTRLDPFEKKNIASEFPKVREAMKTELAEFIASCEASAADKDYR